MIAAAVAAYLDGLALVTYDETQTGGDCFVWGMPESPDDAVGITGTGGAEPDHKFGYDIPSIQVRVRGGSDPRPPYERARAIYDALENLRATTIPDGHYVVRCEAMQSDPMPIGADAAGRQEFTINWQLEVRSPSLHRG
jgi:hypothetical protein